MQSIGGEEMQSEVGLSIYRFDGSSKMHASTSLGNFGETAGMIWFCSTHLVTVMAERAKLGRFIGT
jgi:hypothetical protein